MTPPCSRPPQHNPITSTLTLWGGIMTATGVYLYKRQIPTQLKIIQARIVAQAGLISGAVGLSLVTALTHDEGGAEHKPHASIKMRSYEVAPAVAGALEPVVPAVAQLK